MNYKATRVDDVEGYTYRDDTHLHPVRHYLGLSAFGMNGWTAANAGDRLVPVHNEDPGNEEVYVVIRGRARFEVDGETIDAPTGTLVFVKPEGERTAFAEEAGTTVLAIGTTLGEAYEPSGWEMWGEAGADYYAGDYEAAIAKARPVVDANPQYAAPAYNLACCEALAGHTDDAIAHLRIAFERRPQLRDLAREDTDFDSLRGEAAFQELVG